jgi:hypothetical protein
MKKDVKLIVKGVTISLLSQKTEDYISLTDMVQPYENGLSIIEKWLRNKNTLEFLGVWEQLNNNGFNSPEFEGIKNEAGINRFSISVKRWIEKTNAIGLIAKAGKYGGTYAQKDIAFEFASWLNPVFKLYLIKEFQILKENENRQKSLDWNLQRTISKINYRIHTDAIRENLTPPLVGNDQMVFVYANEADLLNVALFGVTAKEWRNKNPDKEGNIRDYASLEQLVVLSNLESINAMLLKNGIQQSDRLQHLNQIARSQITSLINLKTMKNLKE